VILESQYPEGKLSGHIRRFLYVRAPKAEMPEVTLLPTGFSYLTFGYGSPARFSDGDCYRELPRLFVGGQLTHSRLKLQPQREFRHLGLEFHPTGLHHCLGLDMSQSLNSFLDLKGRISQEHYRALSHCFVPFLSFEAQCARLERFFTAMTEGRAAHEPVDEVVAYIQRQEGRVSVGELAEKAFCTSRHLRRRFRRLCGIGPQQYANIVRIQSIFAHIHAHNRPLLKELAWEAGFHDVAHFVHAFKKHFTAPPASFILTEDPFRMTYLGRK
jgi:AraC-like DNA-binding protein